MLNDRKQYCQKVSKQTNNNSRFLKTIYANVCNKKEVVKVAPP